MAVQLGVCDEPMSRDAECSEGYFINKIGGLCVSQHLSCTPMDKTLSHIELKSTKICKDHTDVRRHAACRACVWQVAVLGIGVYFTRIFMSVLCRRLAHFVRP
jgi:hypothetical protein